MNYYKRHIGDYAAKAGHLTPLEHGVYTLILDAYYNREQGPTEAEAIRWARARNPEETQAVSSVLQEFFVLQDGQYIQGRVEEELAAAKAKAGRNREVGKLGGRPPRERKTKRVTSGLGKKPQSTNPLIHLDMFLADCKAKGEKPIPDDDPIFAYAESIGLPHEYLALAWTWFKAARAGKQQKGIVGWRAHFRDAVKGNWPKYWWPTDDGGWKLTPAGEQARRAAK